MRTRVVNCEKATEVPHPNGVVSAGGDQRGARGGGDRRDFAT